MVAKPIDISKVELSEFIAYTYASEGESYLQLKNLPAMNNASLLATICIMTPITLATHITKSPHRLPNRSPMAPPENAARNWPTYGKEVMKDCWLAEMKCLL